MAIPKPQPRDWLQAAADELRIGDRETLKLLQESYRHVNQILKGLPDQPDAAFGNLIYRAQLERTRKRLLEEQAALFDKLGNLAAARRLRSASRAAKLSRAADNAYLSLVGLGEEGKRLYDGADITSQRTVETLLARIGLSKVPLAERIYKTSVWMHGRLDRLIAHTMATGLNAARFAKVARDWFAPSVPGGTRYAALRLARTEINNAFHATSIAYAQDKPWVSQMEWNLSKSHPTKDKCDLYAAESPWPVHLVPRKPHPQCLCYVTEVSMAEDEWIDKFVAGEFDEYLDSELAKVDSPTEQLTATGQPAKVDKSKQEPQRNLPTIQPEPAKPLTGQAIHDSIPKGLFKRGSLTPEQRKGLQTYETGWFIVINGFLRRKLWGDPEYKDEERDVGRIDSAMAESALPQAIQTWRGLFKARNLFGDRLDNDLTGFSWQELGYGSTTSNPDIARLFLTGLDPSAKPVEDSVRLKVNVVAGVHALETSSWTKGSKANGPQAEVTLERGLQWKVVKDNGVDAEGVRDLEVIVGPVGSQI